MTMLPDIDQDQWDQYERDRVQREMDTKLSTFTLDHQMDSRIAQLAPMSSDALTNPLGTGNAPAPLPEPAVQPEVAPPQPVEQPPEPLPTPSAPSTVSTAPAGPYFAGSARSALARAQPSKGGGQSDWIGQTASNRAASGGDIGKFLNNLTTGGDMVGNAMTAAHTAGADLGSFMSNLSAPPAPQSAPAMSPTATRTGGGAAGPAGVPGWLSDMISRNA